MTPTRGINLSEHVAYRSLNGEADRSLGCQIRYSLYLLIPGAGGEIILEHIT